MAHPARAMPQSGLTGPAPSGTKKLHALAPAELRETKQMERFRFSRKGGNGLATVPAQRAERCPVRLTQRGFIRNCRWTARPGAFAWNFARDRHAR
jgi:hypothetical protein